MMRPTSIQRQEICLRLTFGYNIWHVLLLVCAALLLFGTAQAQDQTVIIRETPRIFPNIQLHVPGQPGQVDEIATQALLQQGVLKQEYAEELIKTVLGAVSPGMSIEEDAAYIIHIYRYLDGETSVDKQNWYVYHKPWADASRRGLFAHLDDLQVSKHFDQFRIYGNTKVALLYLHLNVDAASREAVRQVVQAKKEALAAEAAAMPEGNEEARQEKQKKREFADKWNAEDVTNQVFAEAPTIQVDQTPISIQINTKKGFAVVRDFIVEERFLPVTYKVAVKKKVPDPQQSARAIAGLAIGGQGLAPQTVIVPVTPHMLGTIRMMSLTPKPADVMVTGFVGGKDDEKELAKKTYDNEGKYHYNFSFAFPFKSYESVTFDLENQALVPKQLKKQNIFAMVNYSPWAIDTKRPQLQLVPTFIYGVPITGKPLHQHLAGIAFGVNYFQPFVGIHFDRTQFEADGQVRTKWVRKFSFGINIPVTTATSLLK